MKCTICEEVDVPQNDHICDDCFEALMDDELWEEVGEVEDSVEGTTIDSKPIKHPNK